MYNTNYDLASSAVNITANKTLKAPGSTGSGFPSSQIADTTANLPVSTSRMVFASGGTFQGSALYNKNGINLGATYKVTTDNAGAIDTIEVVNPGFNVGIATQTIIFNAVTLNAAFGLKTVTGDITITTVAGDFQGPYPAAATSIYTGNDAMPNGGPFGLYGGTTDASGVYAVQVELASAQPGDFTLFSNIPTGTILPIAVRSVYVNSPTTASNLIALY
jgi:hypothetical protein|tara:strand:- start:1978 stop:2634 length:657 start_codon:yes stop_codon:yes gene_type:complete